MAGSLLAGAARLPDPVAPEVHRDFRVVGHVELVLDSGGPDRQVAAGATAAAAVAGAVFTGSRKSDAWRRPIHASGRPSPCWLASAAPKPTPPTNSTLAPAQTTTPLQPTVFETLTA
jgi:hypothetical protein